MIFSDWFTQLKSNTLFWMRTQEMYGKKDLVKIASEVHLYLIAKGELTVVTDEKFTGWRVLFQAFCRKAPDVTTVHLQQDEICPQVKPKEEPPLTGEARQRRIKEFLDMVQSAPVIKPVAKPSSREIIENGQWRPKPPEIHEPSEVEKLIALNEHINKLTKARTRYFLDAKPNATEEEIEEYLNKFDSF